MVMMMMMMMMARMMVMMMVMIFSATEDRALTGHDTTPTVCMNMHMLQMHGHPAHSGVALLSLMACIWTRGVISVLSLPAASFKHFVYLETQTASPSPCSLRKFAKLVNDSSLAAFMRVSKVDAMAASRDGIMARDQSHSEPLTFERSMIVFAWVAKPLSFFA